jgi:hypothetical protein
MRLVPRHRGRLDRRRRGHAAAVVASLGIPVVVLAILAPTASAAPLSTSSRAARSSLCGVSKAVAADIVHSTKLVGPADTPPT